MNPPLLSAVSNWYNQASVPTEVVSRIIHALRVTKFHGYDSVVLPKLSVALVPWTSLETFLPSGALTLLFPGFLPLGCKVLPDLDCVCLWSSLALPHSGMACARHLGPLGALGGAIVELEPTFTSERQ